MKRILYILIALALVVALLAFIGKQRLNDRKMISTMASGINIYKALFSNEAIDTRTFPLPQSSGDATFKTSTDFLRCFVTSGYMTVEFRYFSDPDFMPPHNLAPEQFKSDYNVWCVVADISPSSADTAPVLFTKNLMLTSLNERPRLTDAPPFGKRGVIVIQKDATGRILKEDEIEGYFSSLGMNNKVLRP